MSFITYYKGLQGVTGAEGKLKRASCDYNKKIPNEVVYPKFDMA